MSITNPPPHLQQVRVPLTPQSAQTPIQVPTTSEEFDLLLKKTLSSVDYLMISAERLYKEAKGIKVKLDLMKNAWKEINNHDK